MSQFIYISYLKFGRHTVCNVVVFVFGYFLRFCPMKFVCIYIDLCYLVHDAETYLIFVICL